MTIKDSGERVEFPSGMVRDVCRGKVNWLLVRSGPMLRRWAQHLTAGAEKYEEDNWLKASGEEELRRFKQSACRHFEQWIGGETDEDHAAAVFYNINGAEYVKGKLQTDRTDDADLQRFVKDAFDRGYTAKQLAAEFKERFLDAS